MAETITMPKLGFDMAEGTLVRWLKKEGETVSKGDILAEIETDKATVEVESSATGIVRKLLVDENTVVPVNTPIAMVGSADEKIEELPQEKIKKKPNLESDEIRPQQKPSLVSPPTPDKTGDILRASPLAKKIAQDKRFDLTRIKGSGPGGRIVRKDVEAAILASQNLDSAIQPVTVTPTPMKAESVKLSKLRQAIGRRMVESKNAIPHFYVTHDYDAALLMEAREQLNKIIPSDERISVNDLIVKAVAYTLRKFPNLNASLDGTFVHQHEKINIGIAVAVEGGLLTVVCRDADIKPIHEIAKEVKGMAARVRAGKVKPEDIEGSTFSISNLGMFDVENFAAIINPPETAILAISSTRNIPVVKDGIIKSGWRMKATISVDHRISDGAEAARFMQALALYLEEPLRLIL